MRFLTVGRVLELAGPCLMVLAWVGFRKDGVRFFAAGAFWKTMTPFGNAAFAAGWVIWGVGLYLSR